MNQDHSRTVTPLPDFPLAAATGQVRSPALSVFSALRGYPERRGEVPGAQRATAATLQLCSRAAHALCERVLKLKLKARAPSCRAFRTCDSVPRSSRSLTKYPDRQPHAKLRESVVLPLQVALCPYHERVVCTKYLKPKPHCSMHHLLATVLFQNVHCTGAARCLVGCPCACSQFGRIMVICLAQAGCREAVLAYLWALVGVNEGRTAGGEKGVLREQATSEGPCLRIACPWRVAAQAIIASQPSSIWNVSLSTAQCARAFARQRDFAQPADWGQACELRWEMPVSRVHMVAGCSDGLAVGTSALCLRFCRPFLGGEEKFMARLDPGFYRRQAFKHAALPMTVHH